MPPAYTHSLGLIVLLTLLLCCSPPDSPQTRGAEEASQSVDLTERDQLAQRHDELARRTKRLWQQGEDAEAYEGLQELLQLYQQIYPQEEFPAGHVHMILCYRDLCRLSEQLGDFDAMLRYGQQGLAMCQQLFTQEQFPHGHVETACMLANLAHASMLHGQSASARANLLRSIEMSESLWKHGLKGLNCETVADLHLSIAATYAQQGDYLQSLHHTMLAVKRSESLPDTSRYLDRVRLSARCLLEHGNAQINVGDYQGATATLQQSFDLSLRLFLAERSTASHLALIDTHVELGILYRLKSDLPQAKWHLRRAQQEMERESACGKEEKHRKQKILLQLLWTSKSDANQTDLLANAEMLRELFRKDTAGLSRAPAVFTRTELQRGVTHHLLGEPDQAENCLRAAYSAIVARHRFNSDDNPIGLLLLANDSLADFYQDHGWYDRAHFHYMNALSLARQLFRCDAFRDGHRLLAGAVQDSATQLWLLGETESAAALYREAMLMCERLYPADDYPRGHRQLMAAYSAWGNVLEREGDYKGATEFFAKAHQIAVAQFPEAEYPHGHDELALVWRDLGRLERAQGRYDVALEYFHKALASYQHRYAQAFPQGHLLVALALSELGRTHCSAGDYAQAEQYHQRSLAMRRQLFPMEDYPHGHPSLATSLRDLGRTFLARNRSNEAFLAFTESAQMEQAVADSFVGGGSEALLLNLAASKFQSLDCLLDAWELSDRPAAEAYWSVWRRRGFVPRLIAQRHRALRQISGAGTAIDRDAYLDVRRKLSRALLVSATSDVEQETIRMETVRQLNARKENLEVRLASQMLPFADATGASEQDLQELVNKLPQDALLVDFVIYSQDAGRSAASTERGAVDEAHLLAFVLAHGQPIVCVRLGDADHIEELAGRWRAAVLNGQENDYGDELRQLVWDPVSQWFPAGTNSVYIAPDGDLATIPWHALPMPDPARLLIEQYAIAMVPHGQFLLNSLDCPIDSNEDVGRVLAVGDLDYGQQAATVDKSAYGLKQAIWRPLQGSRDELEDLAAVAGRRECVQLTGSAATTAAVIQQLSTCRWAHLATHGFFVDDVLRRSLRLTPDLEDGHELAQNRSRTSVLRRSPFIRSGLALSDANQLGRLDQTGVPLEGTGILTAESIAAVDCSGLELVVLSACESGRGDVVHGDGVFGIQTAFHVAGARNVIASLWKIDDRATADLMSVFYRLLWTDGLAPLAALRGAQLEMLRRSRSASLQTRGPVLGGTVPLPHNATDREPATSLPDLRLWAGFMLSGPGF